jgi:hypothetical protein
MMLAVRIERNVFLHKHLVIVILVFKESGVRPVLGIQPTKYFLDVHFGDTPWSTVKTVVGKIQSKDGHYLPKMFFNALDLHFIIQFKGIGS